MRMLLRQDASPSLGVGHLARSLAIAVEARRRGHDPVLCGEVSGAWARSEVEQSGLELLPPGADVAGLAELAQAAGVDLVHVDHYGRTRRVDVDGREATSGADVVPALRDTLRQKGIHLSNLQDGDFGRRPADLVVDPTALGSFVTGSGVDDPTALMVDGPGYLPLRPAVLAARSRRRQRAGGLGDRPRVIVVMGGTDSAGVAVDVVRSVVAADVPADVLAVAALPGTGVLTEAMSTRRVRVLATPVRSDLPRLLAEHDLAVCAAGTTAWELCCIGTPMALVQVADNQQMTYDGLVDAGAAIGLGRPGELSHAAARLRSLLRDSLRRLDVAATAAGLVDGGGAARVVDLMEALAAGAEPVWRLRARRGTPADADRLLTWRNDPDTQRASRQQGPVDWQDHLRWLDASLASPQRHLLVVEDAEAGPVGTVRWDRLDSDLDADWEVSVTVAPEQRGRGVSAGVLAEGERLLHALVDVDGGLLARVHQDNHRSARLFEKAGYLRQGDPPDDLGFLRYLRPAPAGRG